MKLPAGPGSVRGLAENATVSSYTGQVQYSVPIELPRGPGGLAPTLALGYDGDLGNGPLGVGWTISQAGIRRSLRLGVPSYTAADEFEVVGIAGGQFVAIGNGEYRVEGEGNRYTGRAVDGGFELTDPDGQVYRFGTTAGGRKASGTKVAFWYLEQVRNVAGQTIDYQYHQDRGEVYLDGIAWGPGTASGRAFRVELAYGDRSDAVVSHRSGFRVESAQRLLKIRVWSFGAVQRLVTLDYETGFALSRLHSVSITSADQTDTLPPLTFTYAAAEAGRLTEIPGLDGWALNLQGTSLFDVDGDGAMDLLRLTASGHSYRRNVGGRFDAPRPLAGAPGISLDTVRLLDLTGDSGAEIVAPSGSQWNVFQLTGPDADHRSFTSLGAWPGAQNVPLSSVAVADLNGDYQMDVISVSGSGLQVRFGGTAGLAPPSPVSAIDPARSFITPGNAATSFPDINGDGLADVVFLSTGQMFLYLGKGDGQFERYADVPYPWQGSFATSQIRLGDLDRDGLMDVAVVRGGDVAWYRGQVNGTFSTKPVVLTRPPGTDASVVVAIADANGNGSEDLVWSSPAGMWILDFAGSTSAGMLTAIDNGLGQTQRFGYTASAQLAFSAAQAGAPWTTTMPISIPVAVKTRRELQSGEPPRSSRLDVRDGIYDRVERRFVGFSESTVTEPDPADGAPADQMARHVRRYAIGLGADRVLRGQVIYERVEDGTGKVFQDTVNDVAAVLIDGLSSTDPRLRRAVVTQRLVHRFEGTEAPVAIRSRFQHDGEGRIIEEDADGRLDLAGDESVRLTTYTVRDPLTHVRDKVCAEELRGADGVPVEQTRRLFGDDSEVAAALCQPGKGWVREELGHLAEEGRWVSQKRTSYDADGNPIGVFGDGVQRTLGYDAHGVHPTSESVSPADGQTLTWTAQWDDVAGTLVRITGANGVTTAMTYDGVGRLTSIAAGDALPHIVYQYHWTGPRPATETFTFDGDPAALAALPASWTPDSGWRHSVTMTNGAGEQVLTAVQLDGDRWNIGEFRRRDARGRVTGLTGAFEFDSSDLTTATPPTDTPTQTLSYDPLDRVIDQVQATGTHKRISYHPSGVTVAIDGLSTVSSRLDGQGRAVHTERTVGDTVESVDATYDAAGRILEFRLQGRAVRHDFVYDSLGRLTSASDPDVGPRTMHYDDAGRVISSENGTGEVVRYAYDGVGRLRSVDGPGVANRFHYDTPRSDGFDHTGGQLAWAEEATGSIDLGYDALGRLAVQQRTLDPMAAGGTGAAMTGRETTQFALSGLVRSVDLGDGVVLPMRHDAAGRLSQIDGVWSVASYSPANLPMREQFGNGVIQRYERDAVNRPTRITIENAGGAFYDVTAGYHANGAVSTLTDHDRVGLDHTAAFDYDGAGRLTSATLGPATAGFQFHYAYDGLQNMIRRDASPSELGILAGGYQYRSPTSRQLDHIVAADGSTIASFAYDAAGRQTQHGGQQLSYNALSQLVRVDGVGTGGAGSVEHRYGYDGNKVSTRSASGELTAWITPNVVVRGEQRDHYVRVGNRVVAKITTSGSAAGRVAAAGSARGRIALAGLSLCWLVALGAMVLHLGGVRGARRRRRRVALAASLAVLAVMAGCGVPVANRISALDSASLVYFHQTYAAGPQLFSDSRGQLLEERRSEPFGAPIDALRGGVVVPADLHGNPINTLNKFTDVDTGWSDHGARWLAPDTAQWHTPDPPATAPDAMFMLQPWALHPYQYVNQNPIVFWDPDGRAPATTETIWDQGRALIGLANIMQKGQGMTVNSPSGGLTSAWYDLLVDAFKSSPTARKVISDIGNDPDPRHAITINVGQNQPGVAFDSFTTNDVDLKDFDHFPVKPSAAHPNEVTRGELVVHFLSERRAAALSPNPTVFNPAHNVGVATQAQYRADLGQVAVTSQTAAITPSGGLVDGSTNLANGTSEVVHFDSNMDITGVDLP